ncbi:vegetative catalase-like [Achroia grisella]|uniref:vegetative catalase-like n=1 Tax=Achroia grisella TaxID=688607 RepID=UPI0027D257FF|nr:vegetative catalase-like [Achroia grisella]
MLCLLLILITRGYACDYKYENVTTEPANRQLLDFKRCHPKPIGILTTSAGRAVDARDLTTINSDLINNKYLMDVMMHFNREKIPERIVHAKGAVAFGYFQVTHDVSRYTKADVFNGIGKKTPLFARLSPTQEERAGSDLNREQKGIAAKFYTKEGNLDLLCLSSPVYIYKDPILFSEFIHAFRRNPKTNLVDETMKWDFITMKPSGLHSFLYSLSDYGIPNGYRTMDNFAIHCYEVYNEQGDRFFVKFNLRTEQGLENLTSAEAMMIAGRDRDYFNRDLYNNIAQKNYPSWKLEMDIMSISDLRNIDYNPFDVTRLWKKGTYLTVQIGRLVLNRNADNFFKVSELSAFKPDNLVPGISAPADAIFKSRTLFYRDAINYRLGVNHNNIEINKPKQGMTYNRDAVPPVGDNMGDAPNYFTNSFNGPVPIVDENRPTDRIVILDSNAVDLEHCNHFYNYILSDDAQRQRLIENIATSLRTVTSPVKERVYRLLALVDTNLGKRVIETTTGQNKVEL